MCGITVILSKNGQKAPENVAREMSQLLKHRGPDDYGIYIHDNIVLAHNRLSIYDTSGKAAQPLDYKHLKIVFNGAIYNFKQIRNTLVDKGYSFITESDTEVVLAAYDYYGIDCFKQFNGQWAIVIYNTRTSQVIISRDRYGIKPLYRYEDTDFIYLSSELKSFFKIPDFEPTINKNIAFAFLSIGLHDHNDETFYEGVNRFPKASCQIINLDTHKSELTHYYKLSNQGAIEEKKSKDYIESYSSLLQDSIKIRLTADVPLTCSLSGGLDSSTIVAYAGIEKPDLSPFSISYGDQGVNSELPYIKSIHEKYNLEGTVLSPDNKELNLLLDDCLYHQDVPFDNTSVLAQFFLYRNMSKKGFKVSLGGQGADEVLAGYDKFYLGLWRRSSLRDKAALIYNLLNKEIVNPLQAYAQMNKYKQRNTKIRKRHLKEFDIHTDRPCREESIQKMSLNLMNYMGLSALLRYEDRNAMAHGIESRLPYLDHRLVDYTFRLPDNLKINKGVKKYIQREAFKNLLPEKIYSRFGKLGFYIPESEGGINQERIQYILDNFDFVKEFFNHTEIKNMTEEKTIWRAYIFTKWVALFIN